MAHPVGGGVECHLDAPAAGLPVVAATPRPSWFLPGAGAVKVGPGSLYLEVHQQPVGDGGAGRRVLLRGQGHVALRRSESQGGGLPARQPPARVRGEPPCAPLCAVLLQLSLAALLVLSDTSHPALLLVATGCFCASALVYNALVAHASHDVLGRAFNTNLGIGSIAAALTIGCVIEMLHTVGLPWPGSPSPDHFFWVCETLGLSFIFLSAPLCCMWRRCPAKTSSRAASMPSRRGAPWSVRAGDVCLGPRETRG